MTPSSLKRTVTSDAARVQRGGGEAAAAGRGHRRADAELAVGRRRGHQ
eukprot:gene21153-biopygen17641